MNVAKKRQTLGKIQGGSYCELWFTLIKHFPTIARAITRIMGIQQQQQQQQQQLQQQNIRSKLSGI